TLRKACGIKNIAVSTVERTIFTQLKPAPDFETFRKFNVLELMRYLKAQHRNFMFHGLPYMQRLIADSETFLEKGAFTGILADLRLSFPMFLQDFSGHILEEEEEMFTYIEQLHEVLFEGKHYGEAYTRMEQKCVQDFFLEHHADDDDMEGIRKVTRNYARSEEIPLLVKVLYEELEAFEKQLQFHAKIENQLLLPKAFKLESGVKWLFERKRNLN
ncbi:MAG: hypothetical protein AAF740_07600, partial [Bacteroidota bacterium]